MFWWKDNKIRTDGVYVFKHKITDQFTGENIKISHMLIFNNEGYVFYFELTEDKVLNVELRELISTLNTADANKEGSKYINNDSTIEIKFQKGRDKYAFTTFQGKISGTNMYLTYKSYFFSETLGCQDSIIYFERKKFKFIKA